ncbi:MAG: hypothetical protein Q4D51_11120 [Eubacteriales bacterium]|nr:hypothetical protein [Eubacteriales bacterium]
MNIKKKRVENLVTTIISIVLVYVLTTAVAKVAQATMDAEQIRKMMSVIRGANYAAGFLAYAVGMIISFNLIFKKGYAMKKLFASSFITMFFCDGLMMIVAIIIVKLVANIGAQNMSMVVLVTQFVIRFFVLYIGCATTNMSDAEREEMQKQNEEFLVQYEQQKAEKKKK